MSAGRRLLAARLYRPGPANLLVRAANGITPELSLPS
jgi:hypothetical protein